VQTKALLCIPEKEKKRTNVDVFCSASLFASYTENQ